MRGSFAKQSRSPCCARRSPAIVARLLRHDARADRRLAPAAVSNDLKRFLALDEAFHRSFAVAIDRSHAWTVVEVQKAQMDRVRYLAEVVTRPL